MYGVRIDSYPYDDDGGDVDNNGDVDDGDYDNNDDVYDSHNDYDNDDSNDDDKYDVALDHCRQREHH